MEKIRLSYISIWAAALFVCGGPALLAQAPAKSRQHKRINTPAQRYIDNLSRSEDLGTAILEVLAVNAAGDTLAERGCAGKMVPASNMKLITTGTALHSLGSDYRYGTRIGYTGKVREDGILEGDVYIMGGGDPTTASGDSIALPARSLFWKWKSFLAAEGIRGVEGRIIGDGRYFEGLPENHSWNCEDIGTYFGTGGNGLSFYRNKQDWFVKPGPTVGSEVSMTVKYPRTPWVSVVNRSVTGPAGSGNTLYLFTTYLYPSAEARGTFAIDRKPKTDEYSNKFAALTCANEFLRYLAETGFKVSGGAADIDMDGLVRGSFTKKGEPAAAQNAVKVAGTSMSPALGDIARFTNYRSDNFYAETLFRTMGKSATGKDVPDSAAVAVADVLEGLGLKAGNKLQMIDGSGLSRKNYVSPEFMVQFLQAMRKSKAYPAFLASLPSPGAEGSTLKSVLKGDPAEITSRIRMKSGSMDGVLCYSGYILPSDGNAGNVIVFSIMTNNCTAPAASVRAALSRAVALLAGEN